MAAVVDEALDQGGAMAKLLAKPKMVELAAIPGYSPVKVAGQS